MSLKNPVVFISGAILPFNFKKGGYFKNLHHIYEENSTYVVPVKHWASVEENAMIIEQFIHQHLSGKSFHIVAHSKGGVDTVFWYQSSHFKSDVLSFVAMASPFKGTKLANYLLALLRFMPGLSDVKKSLSCLCLNQIERYTVGVEPPQSAYIVSRIKGIKDTYPLLYLSYLFLKLFEGDNDGVVSVNSSKKGKLSGEYYCDHPGLIGHFNSKKREDIFKACAERIKQFQQEVEKC